METLGDFVNAASGILLLLTGVALFALARGRGPIRLLGATVAFWGLNYALRFLESYTWYVSLGTAATACLLAVAVPAAWCYPRRATRRESLALTFLLTVSLLWLFMSVWEDLQTGPATLLFRATGPGLHTAFALTAAAFLPSAFAIRAFANRNDARRLALLTLVFGLYSAYNAARVIVMLIHSGYVPASAYFFLAMALLPVPLWLMVGGVGGARRLARNTAWTVAAAACTGAVLSALFEPGYGIPGAIRTLSWGVLALAVLRYDLLQQELPRIAVSRGSVATTGLLALIIVAQIAQEFISAEYGLLVGGAVAGSMVFMARPIERALEERRSTRRRVAGPAAATPNDASEEAYRTAVRLALRDRALTREEESQLHGIAERFGIGGRRAHAILVEVERERRGEAT